MDEVGMADRKPIVQYFSIITVAALFLSCNAALFSQTEIPDKPGKRKVELIHADEYRPDENMGRELGKFLGNVAFRHNEIVMTCDSAYFFQNKNQLQAFSRVHIEQGDTLDIYGDYLFYDGTEEVASLNGNVILIDRETNLYTPSITYDVKNRVAVYTAGGRITNGENTLTSIIGNYYVNEKLFHFKDSIRIVNPDYVMSADTMDYNTESETVFFTGPAEVEGDSIYIYSEKGWYDTKNDITRLWKNAIIDNRQQEIKGDSVYYEDARGFGEAFNNVTITDTTNDVLVKGDYAWYFKDPERFLVTSRATFIQVSDGDSLFLHSDTISAVTISDTSGLSYRLMRSWYGCRIFSSNLQCRCDSLSYSFRDSVIRLYYEPVLWSEENQLTSDSVAIFTRNRQADRMELYNTAFIASKVDSLRFNQIKGRKLTGYFIDNKLRKIIVEGNGESVYYLADKDELIGVTHNKSSSIEIMVKEGKIAEITEFQNPDGKLDPPLLNTPDKMKLPGFSWLDFQRPMKVSDIYRK
jgi:lipopolysaccharide export system protein LptA